MTVGSLADESGTPSQAMLHPTAYEKPHLDSAAAGTVGFGAAISETPAHAVQAACEEPPIECAVAGNVGSAAAECETPSYASQQ